MEQSFTISAIEIKIVDKYDQTQTIPFQNLVEITTYSRDGEEILDIEFHHKNRAQRLDKIKRVNCKTIEEKNELLKALNALENIEVSEVQLTKIQEVIPVTLTLILFSGLTYFFQWLAHLIQTEGTGSKRRVFATILGLIGPIPIIIVGGIFILLSLYAIFVAITSKPRHKTVISFQK